MIAALAGKHTDMVGQYVMEKIPGLVLTPGMFVAFMIVNDQMDFVGGVVFTNYRETDGKPTDVEISCAAETPIAFKDDVCRAIFKYVFETAGCVRCTSITVKGNKKARDFLQGLGFQLEGNIRSGYDGRRDALIYGLLRDECRFLKDPTEALDGEEERTRAPASTGPGSDGAGAEGNEHRVGDLASEPQPD